MRKYDQEKPHAEVFRSQISKYYEIDEISHTINSCMTSMSASLRRRSF